MVCVNFSSHNAKQLVVWPALQRGGRALGVWRHYAFDFIKSVPLAIRTIRSGALSRGAGYIVDFGHWGSLTHISTPESITSDAQSAGLEIIEVVGEVAAAIFLQTRQVILPTGITTFFVRPPLQRLSNDMSVETRQKGIDDESALGG